jgi:hypothetical protein
MNESHEPRGRRRLLGDVLRYGALGLLGLVGGRLLAKAKRGNGPLHPDEKCISRGLCRGCGAIDGCRSPQADLFRRARKEA